MARQTDKHIEQAWHAVRVELEDMSVLAVRSLVEDQRKRGVSYAYRSGTRTESPVLVMVACGSTAAKLHPAVGALFEMAAS